MMRDDNDDQMIFGDLVGLKLPDIHLTGEEKPRKNLTQETCPDQARMLPLAPQRWTIYIYMYVYIYNHFIRICSE